MTTADQRTVINDCGDNTGWVGTDNATQVTGVGLRYEGAEALSTQYSNTAPEQMNTIEDTVSIGTFSLDLSLSSLYMVVKTNLNETLGNGGGMIVVGDGVDLIGLEVFGSDELGIILDLFFYGVKMDLSNTLEPANNAFSGSLGALNLAAIDRLGWGANHLAKANGPSDNVYFDIFTHIVNKTPAAHNPVLIISAGTASVPETIADTAADDITSGLGVVANIGGNAYQIFCPMQFGAEAGSADHYFLSEDEQWFLKGRFMAPKNFDFFLQFDSTGTNSFVMTRSTVIGLGTRSNWDLRIIAAGAADLMKFTASTFTDLGQTWFGSQDAGDKFVLSHTFNNCDGIYPDDLDFDACTLNGSNQKQGGIMLHDNLSDGQTGWVCNAGGLNGPAFQASKARSIDADNWTFTDYSANDAVPYNTETDVDGVNDEIDITTHPFATEDPVVFVPVFATPALPEDNGLPFAYFDDFDRADESLETATAWQNLTGSAVQIVSNAITGTTGASATRLNSSVIDTADHAIEADVVVLPSGALTMSMLVRGTTSDRYTFEIDNGGDWTIERLGSTPAQLLDGSSANAIDNEIVAGDRVRVEITDDANSDPQITVYVNGKFLAIAWDRAASPFTTGTPGFEFDATETTGRFNNVVIEDLDNVVYVRSVTANSISLHTTAAGAAADTGQIVLTASAALAGETHNINSYNAAFHNMSAGAITYGVLNNGDTPSVWNGPGASTTVNNNVTIESNGMTEGAAVKVVANETVGTLTVGDILDERLADSAGEAIFTINYEAAFGAGLDVIVRAAQNGLPNAAVADDGAALTDETTAANSTTADDMTLTPDNPQDVNDAFYFGHSEQFVNGPNATIRLKLEISQIHGAGNPTIVWEFFNGLTWAALTFTDADPNPNFTTLGEHIYEFDAEAGWSTTTINGQGPFYYVRARVSVAGTSTNGARGRFTTLDVTKYFRQDLRREVTSDGLTTTVPWNINTLAQFDPAND